MSRSYDPGELAVGLGLILEKNRDSLTVTEIHLLAEAIVTLESLSNPDAMQSSTNIAEKALQVITNLLRFFSCLEIIEQLTELL